jgi:hypothetical protein
MCQKVSGATVSVRTFKAMVIKHAKQTTLKWQENTTSPKAIDQRRKQTEICKFYMKIVVCTDSNAEWTVHLLQHHYSTNG